MHSFTSITANYLPKARVLASSIKRHNPDCQFHILISDKLPEWIDMTKEPFDSVITIEELGIPNLSGWIFKHSIVELCTAVKGLGFQEILKRHNAEIIFYFDPDIVVFSSLANLIAKLKETSVLLTPHQTVPETDRGAIIDNEISSLKHGVYNLGFLALRNTDEGRKFLKWWSDRLSHFCYDDICGGLFTDQRWMDLAPAFFQDIHILREPNYNVSTWNLTHRTASGSLKYGVKINGLPLCFYHFSGFDSGAQEVMLNKYIGNSHVLKELRKWYIEQCRVHGQDELGLIPGKYCVYDNGEKIGKNERILYRSRQDLQAAFPNPFDTNDIDKSYFHWYRANVTRKSYRKADGKNQDTMESLRSQLSDVYQELNTIKASGSWRLVRAIASLRKRFFLTQQPINQRTL
ncbi:MAG: hypothetical protein ACRESZ_21435 [Methylococcales bacterium]